MDYPDDRLKNSAGIHPAPIEFTNGQIAADPILQFFHYAHLPPKLQETSKAFFLLAMHVINTVPRNPERTVALRKLLEAKDAAVRANLPVPELKTYDEAMREEEVMRRYGEPVDVGEADIERDGPPAFKG